jgi:hypothetical protein
MLRLSIFSRFTHRTNSAKLGRPTLENPCNGLQHQIIHFGLPKRPGMSLRSQSDSFTKSADEHHTILNNRHRRTISTSLPRMNRDHQPLNVVMTKTSEGAHVILPVTPDLLRCARGKRRSIWSTRPQVTL